MGEEELKQFLDNELEKVEISHLETLRRHKDFTKMYCRIKRKYNKNIIDK